MQIADALPKKLRLSRSELDQYLKALTDDEVCNTTSIQFFVSLWCLLVYIGLYRLSFSTEKETVVEVVIQSVSSSAQDLVVG